MTAKNHLIGVDFVLNSSEASYSPVEQTIYIEVFAGSVEGAIKAVNDNKEAVSAYMQAEHLEISRVFDASNREYPSLIDIINQHADLESV